MWYWYNLNIRVPFIIDRKELEKEMQQENRLPPGQTLTLKFPVLHYGAVPLFVPQTWNFRIFGEVEEEKTWTWSAFQQLPRVQVRFDLHCVTRWSKFDTHWEGISIKALLDEKIIIPKPSAKYVIQHAEYGFTTNLPLEIVASANFLLATHYEGEPISPEHGYPVRGLVGALPGKRGFKDVYLWKGAKWLRGLEFSSIDKPGFWEQAGYHNEADIWKEQRMG
jgi:DMSO/TMAO reductase YedYZ molybdopterin-dependent catalytic subunit